MIEILSVRDNQLIAEEAIRYIQSKWANDESMMLYEDCINSSLTSSSLLPQWYLAMDGEKIVGCCGLIPNDFISRMELYPWLCAVFVEEETRGQGVAKAMVEHVVLHAKALGFTELNLCTEHEGLYEKFGFSYIGKGYHPWPRVSRVYQKKL